MKCIILYNFFAQYGFVSCCFAPTSHRDTEKPQQLRMTKVLPETVQLYRGNKPFQPTHKHMFTSTHNDIMDCVNLKLI